MSQILNVDKVRAEFPTLLRSIRGRDLIYLDNAASTLKPNVVIDRIKNYYSNETSNVHRGAHFLAEQGTISYEGAREAVRRFINASSLSEVVFTRGTTESVNLVAQAYGETNFDAGDEILISELEHHSNIVPWQLIAEKRGCKIRVIPVSDSGEIIFESYLELLNSKTKMVSIAWCSNTLGTVTDIKKYIDAAHAAGAKIFIDAAQAVQHLKTDVQKLDCDFLAFSGHKIYGPYGIGILYGKEALLEKMPPYQGGGSMISEVTFEKTTWADLPQKFEAGTPSIADAIGLGSAIEFVESLGLDQMEGHEQTLLKAATERLSSIEGLRVIGQAPHKTGILSFVIDKIHPSDLGSLIDQEGIAIRTGHHCTQPLMKRYGIPATARASFAVYNTLADVDSLYRSLVKAKEFF